jgi:hypothetical protein
MDTYGEADTITEVTGRNAMFEVGLAVRAHSREKVLLIADQETLVPVEVAGFRLVRRPEDLTEAADVVAFEVENWLNGESASMNTSYSEAASRSALSMPRNIGRPLLPPLRC